MPETFVFYVFSAVWRSGRRRSSSGSATRCTACMLLIASFGALAGLYIQLDAPFVAVAQIIIYAGAIMVLFLFVVMLLNAPQRGRRRVGPVAPVARTRHRAVRRAAGDAADRAAGLGAGEGRRARGAGGLAQRCRDRSARCGRWVACCSPGTRSRSRPRRC